MPNPPISSLSLIVHLVINLFAFLVGKISHHTSIRWPTFHTSYTEQAKKVNVRVSPYNHYFSYGIIISIFTVFIIFATFILGSSKSVYIADVVSNVFGSPAPEPIVVTKRASFVLATEGMSLNPEKLDLYNSIQDLLVDSGYSHDNFSLRAGLAVELGIVEEEGDYTGTSAQNTRLLSELRKQAIAEEEISER